MPTLTALPSRPSKHPYNAPSSSVLLRVSACECVPGQHYNSARYQDAPPCRLLSSSFFASWYRCAESVKHTARTLRGVPPGRQKQGAKRPEGTDPETPPDVIARKQRARCARARQVSVLPLFCPGGRLAAFPLSTNSGKISAVLSDKFDKSACILLPDLLK